jgi:hypothetical protein
MTPFKVLAGIAVVIAVLCAVGCSPQRALPESAAINAPGVYQQMPSEAEPLPYAPINIHEGARPIHWKGN